MLAFFDKKSVSFLLILFTVLILTISVCVSLFIKISSGFELLDPIFQPSTPSVVLLKGELLIDGTMPHTVVLENGVIVMFAEMADSVLIANSPRGSVSIGQDRICFKWLNDVKSIDASEIDTPGNRDRIVLDPVSIGAFLQRFSASLFVLGAIVIFLLFALLLYLLVMLLSGIGIMIDAFSNGSFTFTQMSGMASVFVLVSSIIWLSIFEIWGIGITRRILLFLIILFGLFVYALVRMDNARRQKLLESEL